MSGTTEVFREHRGLLIGVAYRVLGSVTDAEDVVQESWLRWSKVDQREVNAPKAFLITTVTRLAIDRLRQVKAQREAYPGTWLPEPVSDIPGGAETAELADSVDLALLVVLETLSPLERAVFVLREAFELPFAEIAEVIGREEAAARQLAKRAREHVQARRPRFEVDRASRREITERFLAASSQGDLDSLTSLLARDVALMADGGGKARSPLQIIVGAEKVIRFFTGISTESNTNAFMASIGVEPVEEFGFAIVEINGAPALAVYAGSKLITLLSLFVADGRVQEMFLVANPEKLEHVTAA